MFNKQFFTLLGFVFFLVGSDIFDREEDEAELLSDIDEIAVGQKSGREYRIRRAVRAVARKVKG